MADPLTRTAVLAPGPLFADADLTLSALPPARRFILRAAPVDAALAGAALGLAMPLEPLATAHTADHAVLWLGPDEWLVLLVEDAASQIAGMHAALEGRPHALADISHRQLAIEVQGRLAARVLASSCPLDLHPTAFAVGMTARTIFHKAEIVLWRRGADHFHVEVGRSFAPYVRDHLITARRGAVGL